MWIYLIRGSGEYRESEKDRISDKGLEKGERGRNKGEEKGKKKRSGENIMREKRGTGRERGRRRVCRNIK